MIKFCPKLGHSKLYRWRAQIVWLGHLSETGVARHRHVGHAVVTQLDSCDAHQNAARRHRWLEENEGKDNPVVYITKGHKKGPNREILNYNEANGGARLGLSA